MENRQDTVCVCVCVFVRVCVSEFLCVQAFVSRNVSGDVVSTKPVHGKSRVKLVQYLCFCE